MNIDYGRTVSNKRICDTETKSKDKNDQNLSSVHTHTLCILLPQIASSYIKLSIIHKTICGVPLKYM